MTMTAAASAPSSKGVKTRFKGVPIRAPRKTSIGVTSRATWIEEPKEIAIEKSMLFLYAIWTPTMCSAMLPTIGTRMTPTNSSESPNSSLIGSMAPTNASETNATAAVATSSNTSDAILPNGACPSPVAAPPSGLRK